MVNSIATTLALFAAAASASSLSAGQAIVVNKCDYEVYLCNVPADGGGYSEEDTTLQTGGSWSQTYTELSNGQGWSIKLSNSTSLESILQYEYTFHNDGTIWFDLSCVNGDPWPANWEITADNGCDPKQTAYRYPTDDDYGMQACSQDASVTVTLCASEGSGSDSGSSSSAPSYATTSVYSATAYTSVSSAQAPAYTSSSSSSEEAPSYSTPTSAPQPPQPSQGLGWFANNNNGEVEAQADHKPEVATTLATSTIATPVASSDSNGPVIVWDVQTAVVTEIVYATQPAGRHRRHEHHARHHE